MIPREKNSRGSNNVTNLDEVRKAKAKASSTAESLESTVNHHTGEDQASDEALDNHADAADTATANPTAQINVGAGGPHGNRRFDAEKVARIKAAIAAGEYKIDPARIADKFIEHDRNQ